MWTRLVLSASCVTGARFFPYTAPYGFSSAEKSLATAQKKLIEEKEEKESGEIYQG